MRIPKFYLGVCFTLLLGVSWGICFYFFHVRHIPFLYECTMAINEDSYAPWHYHYVSTEEKFLFWIYDHQITDNLPPLIDNFDLNSFDFAKYDYLLFIGERLTDLSHSPWLSHTKDAICRQEDSRVPLIPTLEKASMDSLYIYKIKKTAKYREPGP